MSKVYYLKAVIIPSGIVLVLNITYCIIDEIVSNYKSEWLTKESLFPIIISLGVINSLAICFLSLTILLTKYAQIKNSLILSSLVWLLFPMIWISMILVKSGADLFNFSDGLESPGIFDILNTAPYIIGLLWSYIRFIGLSKNSDVGV